MTSSPSRNGARITHRLRNVVLASLVGSVVEWYDFALFGAAAALIFGHVFFPRLDPVVGGLLSLLTYATGYLARPLGAILFGHFGDRIGRKPVLIVSFLVMGGSTTLMGLLPGYAMIGVAAPILLVTLRLIQGIAVGGEFGGAALLATETAPPDRRGLYSSSALVGQSAGILLGIASFAGFSHLPAEQFQSWGWRMPFLASLSLVLMGWWIRRKVEETADFTVARTDRPQRAPLIETLRGQPRRVLLILGARIAQTTQYNIASIFALGYGARTLHIPSHLLLTGMTIASFVAIVVMPLGGLTSDLLGRRPVSLFGAMVSIVTAVAFFPMLQSGSPLLVVLSIVLVIGVTTGLNNAVPSAYFPELFPVATRYTAISLGYQLGTVAGGFTPAICTLLALRFGTPAVAAYLIGAGVLMLLSFLCLPETRRRAMRRP